MYPSGTAKAVIHPKGFYDKPIHVDQALTVAGGATPTNVSTTHAIVKGCDKLEIGAKMTGSATEVDVSIYVVKVDGTILSDAKYTFTLTNTKQSDVVAISPGMYAIAIGVTNKDTTNAVTGIDTWVEATWR